MPNHKNHNRLVKLEERSAAKVDRQHDIVYIPALATETDEQAVHSRLGSPACTHYNIIVFRRKNRSFEITIYDQTFGQAIAYDSCPHPDEYTYLQGTDAGDNSIIHRFFHQTMCGLEGRDYYNSV